MILLQPLLLGFLALLPVIIIFHILRARHQRHEIPSTRFWRGIASDLEGRPALRFPRLSLLLLLQLLVVIGLALALSRPAFVGGEKRHLIVVLDAAVSMQATDVMPSRFEEARDQARRLVAVLEGADEITLVRAGRLPVILAEATGHDPSPVLVSLAGATPSAGPSDMFAALALAGSLVGQHADARNEIVVLSDGVFPHVEVARLGSPSADLRLVPIGRSAHNVAITQISVRPMLGNIGRQVCFLRVSNFGDDPADVPLRVSADGLAFDSRRLRIPADGAVELTLDVPNGSRLVEARLDTDDFLRLDDQALAQVPTSRDLAVMLVSNNTAYWDRVLKAIPQVNVTQVRPDAYRPGPADVVIFDGFQPPLSQWPNAGILLVNPLPASTDDELPQISVLGEVAGARVIRAEREAPVLASVDLASISLPKSLRLKLPSWAHAIAESDAGPLIFEGSWAGRQTLVVGFDPAQTDLPQRLGFPILVANALTRLAPSAVPLDLKPGTVAELQPPSGATEILVRLPSGKVQSVQTSAGSVRFGLTETVGRYLVTYRDGTDTISQQTFVVNATDELASNIRPNGRALDDGWRGAGQSAESRESETWPLILATGLALLVGEWWYYCRRRG